jgi:hypothetical protein
MEETDLNFIGMRKVLREFQLPLLSKDVKVHSFYRPNDISLVLGYEYTFMRKKRKYV